MGPEYQEFAEPRVTINTNNSIAFTKSAVKDFRISRGSENENPIMVRITIVKPKNHNDNDTEEEKFQHKNTHLKTRDCFTRTWTTTQEEVGHCI